jgi:hypothetical protein
MQIHSKFSFNNQFKVRKMNYEILCADLETVDDMLELIHMTVGNIVMSKAKKLFFETMMNIKVQCL